MSQYAGALSVTISMIGPHVQRSSSKIKDVSDLVFSLCNICHLGYNVSAHLACTRYSNLPALGIFIVSMCALRNKPPGIGTVGGIWSFKLCICCV